MIQPANSPLSQPPAASSTFWTYRPESLPLLLPPLPRRGSAIHAVSQPTSPRAAPSRPRRLSLRSRSSQIKHVTSQPPTTSIRPSTNLHLASAPPPSTKALTRTRILTRQTTTQTSPPTCRRCRHRAVPRHARQACRRRARAAPASDTVSLVLATASSSTVVVHAAATLMKTLALLTLTANARLAMLHVVTE